MIKNIIFGLSLAFAEDLIEVDSEEFTSAVHQKILERRKFWVYTTEKGLYHSLVGIKDEMLLEYLEDNKLDSKEVSLVEFEDQVTKDREEIEITYAEQFEKIADDLVPEIEEETM